MKKFILITLTTLLAGGTLSTNVKALDESTDILPISLDENTEDNELEGVIEKKEVNESSEEIFRASNDIESRFEMLSDDLKKLYNINNSERPMPKEEYLNAYALDMYTHHIWSHEPTGEVFVVKDFTGIDQFTSLQSTTIAFVGNMSEYNFNDISKLEDVDISLNYEPRILSDHATGGPGMRYKYMYSKEHEDGIINFLEEFGKHITPGNNINITVGVGMNTIPRMYRYDWMVEYLNKDVNVNFMQQDSNNIYHVLEYEVTYDENKKKTFLSYDIDNPFNGFIFNGTEFVRTPNTFGQFVYYGGEEYENLSFYNKDGNEIKIIVDGEYVATQDEFDDVVRIKADMNLEKLIEYYYDDGKPIQMGPTTELPTGVSHFSLMNNYYEGNVYGNLNISFAIYVELPSIINFESDITEDIFAPRDLVQYRRNGQLLTEPKVVNQPINYVFEGWYTTDTFDEGTEWDFETNIVETNAYVYDDQFARSGITQSPEKLYAKWTPRSEYVTVDFVTNNDQIIEEQFIKKGTLAKEPTDFEYDGYRFLGWYTDENFINKWNFATAVNADMTLYAQWEQITYTVTFDSKGGSEVNPIKEVLPNATISAPINPTKEGYDFVQWEHKGAVWNFASSKVVEDITLDAVWEAKEDTKEPEVPTVKDPDPKDPTKPEVKDPKDVKTGISNPSQILLVSILGLGIVLLVQTRKRKLNK